MRKPDIEEVLKAVTVRILSLMFAAITTTSLTLSQVVLDLMTEDQTACVEKMRAETTSAVSRTGNNWTLASVQSLELTSRFVL
jgi:hypothetical protein